MNEEIVELGFTDAKEWCEKKSAELLLPKTQEDLDLMKELMIKYSIDTVWVPITDIESNGDIIWTDRIGKILYN